MSWIWHANRGWALVLAALATGGCSSKSEPVPAACTADPATILTALARAPAPVVLADGTRLSTCVGRARTSGDLQSLGHVLGRVADTLRAGAASDPRAALTLGYLAGAVQRGAAQAQDGIADQLARRIDQLAALEPGAPAEAGAALRRGHRAGESGG